MMNRIAAVLVVACVFGVVSVNAAWVDPVLLDQMEQVGPNGTLNVFVVLTEQLDARRVVRDVRRHGGSLADQHYHVITKAQDLAAASQTSLLSTVTASEAKGAVTSYRAFWIQNAIAMRATVPFIKRLASHGSVASIYLDYPIELIEPVAEDDSDDKIPAAIENGVADSRAPELWALGFDGTGTLACDQDTGADGSHPAFDDRWRGLDPGVDPSHAWFDPRTTPETFPTDSGTHGTHTLGTIVGDDGAGNQIGMAPGAKWIGARTIDTGGDIFSDAVAAFEWAADPDGNPATMDDVPDVVNNSWGLSQSYYGSCRTDFNAAIDVAEAAGVVVVFAAGNEGTSGLRSPGNRIASDLNTFAVGAINQDGTTIASFSSRGPSDCDNATIKPEVSAVGVDVRSSLPGGGYGTKSGTSMATPHVAGAVLLLRGAFPEATVDEVKLALYMSAVDLGDAGEDNTFGRGKIDVVEAYLFLLDYLVNPDGKVQIGDVFSCDDAIEVTVLDADLTGPSIQVAIESDTETTPEPVTLFESGTTQGKYAGSIDTEAGSPAADGVLQVSDTDTVTVRYIDADDGEGGINVEKTDTATVDCAAPAFAGLTGATPGDHKVTLTWDPAADVNPVTYNIYRAAVPGGQDFENPIANVDASPYVDDVSNGTTYFYVARAIDSVGNEDANTVELSALPTGPNLIWEETWESETTWLHDWEIVNGGTGDQTWTDTNPGNRSVPNVNGTFIIADSDYAGTSEEMDEELISEVIDITGYENILLRFVNGFRRYQSEICDVDARFDGGDWETLATYTGTSSETPIEIDLAEYDFTTIQLRFHYYNAIYEWWWALDDIQIWGWEIVNNITCYEDSDGDTFGNPGVSEVFADECPAGWSANGFDCDDGNSAVNPNAADAECDGVDNDCDTDIDEDYEPYTCGQGECQAQSTCASGVDECLPGDPVDEVCDDGLDNDCDGLTDGADPDCEAICPTASFTSDDDELTVDFTDTSTAGTAPIVSWLWDFGDGFQSQAQSPSHSYDEEGTFEVCLTVEDENGCTDNACSSITVDEEAEPGCGTIAATGSGMPLVPMLLFLIGFAALRRRA